MINREKPGEHLGTGAEKEVYTDPNNRDRVVAYFREHVDETPNQIKARFYLTKILHLLMPKNIPDMHWAGSDPHAYQTDKIEVDENHKIMQEYVDLAREAHHKKYKINEELSDKIFEIGDKVFSDNDVIAFKDRVKEIGVNSLDHASINFSKNSEGNVQYLDSFYAWKFRNDGSPKLFFDFDILEAAIKELPEKDQKSASNFLRRLKELYEEEKKQVF
ncbi:hypothetical protein HYT01_01270 [Candidatus Giovannonibacteria bacterium]|nr:hypothetical protein [Candidatus Giovannonibacteria bacterium]